MIFKTKPNSSVFLILILIFLIATLFPGCSKKRLLSKNSYRQHYVDISKRYFPEIPGELQRAGFARINADPFPDLVLHVQGKNNTPQLLLVFNREKKGFRFDEEFKTAQIGAGEILFFTVGDFNADRADDLVIIQREKGKHYLTFLFNNRKGYYYKKVDHILPGIRQGVERADAVDVDHDGDLDLFFYGRNVLNPEGRPDKHQSQLFINNGQGDFEDLSSILLPPLPAGMVATSFADYDVDGVRDIFLIYGNGPNRLLLNNSVGKFSDKTSSLLPLIRAESVHADWADFDGDGDNDLLVVNRRLDKKYQDHADETNYFLENNGKGRFTKRSHPILPAAPTSRAYLLDANGNEIPDALLLSENNTVYLQGKGEWKFSVETVRRLPRSIRLLDITFGDIDDDGYLDVFGIDPDTRQGKLWLNRFK